MTTTKPKRKRGRPAGAELTAKLTFRVKPAIRTAVERAARQARLSVPEFLRQLVDGVTGRGRGRSPRKARQR